jgi:DNA polymerase-3 subunit delta'
MDFVSADSMLWLRQAQERLRQAHANGRLPHSLLLLSVAGLGAELLAHWIGAFVLCESPGKRPCGACASCRLLMADTHPDHHLIGLQEGSQQIKVEQVRELMEPLALKSYRGGYKVGVIENAETLNTHGANAFLKTLEEPTADTMLIVIARPNHRLQPLSAAPAARAAERRGNRVARGEFQRETALERGSDVERGRPLAGEAIRCRRPGRA